jgi:hypothetical protein
MSKRTTTRRSSPESGVALLISLFVLLLVCVVGVALIMASGTDSALTGNYRSASSVYYAAMAGLEEGRSRLLPQSPNGVNLNSVFGAPAPAPGQVWYIINPLPGEVVAPWDTATATTYPDTEYLQEFGTIPPAAPAMQETNSVSATPSGSGPVYTMYKWIRINGITVSSARNVGVNVDNHTGAGPLSYVNNSLNIAPPGQAALEITALAALPNGSQRMLQYVVAPIGYNPAGYNLNFNSALTLDGNGVSFTAPPSNGLTFNGTDSQSTATCNPGGTVAPAGIGYTNAADAPNIIGASGSNPGSGVVSVPSWQTYNGLNQLVQTLNQYHDLLVTVPPGQDVDQSIFPAAMSATNPMTIIVDGNLKLNGWHNTGYGILLVTGTFTYDPDASWDGIVLVVGQGNVVSTQHGGGVFNGAVLVANTVSNPGSLGPASWQQDFGAGVNYSTCWINAVQNTLTYKVLSFREIPLT